MAMYPCEYIRHNCRVFSVLKALRVESAGKFAPFHSRKFFFTRMGPDKPDRAAAVQDMIPQSILRGVSSGIFAPVEEIAYFA